MYLNAIENMDFIKPHNKCPVIDHLNGVQYNEHSRKHQIHVCTVQ